MGAICNAREPGRISLKSVTATETCDVAKYLTIIRFLNKDKETSSTIAEVLYTVKTVGWKIIPKLA